MSKKTILAALLMTTGLIACGGGGAADGTERDTAAGQQPDFRRGFSAEGLTIETSAPMHIAGRFARRGTTIHFDLAREGEARHLRIESASGQPILDTVLAGGIDSSTYFGGVARAEGPVDGAEPKLEGDATVWNQLEASAEARLLPELKEALSAGHVDETLFRPGLAATRAGDVTPKYVYFDGTWWHISTDDERGFWSWSWWGTTTVTLADEANPWGGCFVASFEASYQYEVVGGCGMQTYRRQWWGAYVNVYNLGRTIIEQNY